MRSIDINKRSAYAFRRLGKSHAGMKMLLTLMNLPPEMTEQNDSNIARCIGKAVKTAAQSCLSDAAKKIKTVKKWYCSF